MCRCCCMIQGRTDSESLEVPMAEKGPMARMQLLLPPDLKAEIEQFAEEQGLSANEAIRVLSRRGLNASGKAPPVKRTNGASL